MSDEDWMRHAIEVCRRGIADGQAPFGCVIVQDDRLVAHAYNTVRADTDPSAHGEVNALRRAARALGSTDLAGCTLYTTCEPCPMCLTTAHWAKIGRIVFGATIDDAEAAGFSQWKLTAATLLAHVGSPMKLSGALLRTECIQLFDEWKAARPKAGD